MSRIFLRLSGIVIAVTPLTIAGSQSLGKTMQDRIDETVATYAAAWNEPDVAARRKLLDRVWAADGTYTDPTAHVEGRDALVEHISRFHKSLPGARIAVTSRADVHHGMVRFTWRLIRPGGGAASEGMDFGVLDGDGRIQKIVGFFGPFVPIER